MDLFGSWGVHVHPLATASSSNENSNNTVEGLNAGDSVFVVG